MLKLRLILLFSIALFSSVCLAQKEIYISQYIHNQYSVNSAFAGSDEALTLFGSARKQWAGIDGAPQAQLISAHTPLKSNLVALGVELFNQSNGETAQTGFSFSYTYRLKQSANNWIGLAVNAGGSSYSSQWQDIPVYEQNDPLFSASESLFAPTLGLGVSWYGPRFFSGISTSNLFYTDVYETGTTSFDMGKAEFICTGGYLASVSSLIQLQPTALIRLNSIYGDIIDLGLTGILNEKFWLGITYRTTEEITAMVGFQPTAHLRIAYSIDLGIGEIASYNSGTHEFSLRYYFGNRVKTISPKFF